MDSRITFNIGNNWWYFIKNKCDLVMKKIKIGEILLDTGVLLLGDIATIKKIKQGKHQITRIFKHKDTETIYEQGKDFNKFTDILLNEMTVNELIEKEIIVEQNQTNEFDLSTENILNDLEQGFKQLKFETGVNGKAFAISSINGEGFYPIYAEITDNRIERLIIDFIQVS